MLLLQIYSSVKCLHVSDVSRISMDFRNQTVMCSALSSKKKGILTHVNSPFRLDHTNSRPPRPKSLSHISSLYGFAGWNSHTTSLRQTHAWSLTTTQHWTRSRIPWTTSWEIRANKIGLEGFHLSSGCASSTTYVLTVIQVRRYHRAPYSRNFMMR